jgi:hypothetical protein
MFLKGFNMIEFSNVKIVEGLEPMVEVDVKVTLPKMFLDGTMDIMGLYNDTVKAEAFKLLGQEIIMYMQDSIRPK